MTRTVKLELTANVSGLQAGLRTAQRATANFAKDLDSFQKKHEQSLDTIGSASGKAGLAAAAGLAMVGKAAIDWESAWTGVKKTVGGTPQQLSKVEDGLRGLAKTLPSTHEEIAGVAEAAGQLGVATNDIVGFTKTMIDLGETTNLTAEDAATNIAQISNVMGTMDREGTDGVARFGAALVALGNDGASTEAEILSMSQRIAGAGATIGASESDVLALSNTLASMGVNAELGGGVMTRVLLKMRTAADEGGESLESFAKVAGVSADEFATKFREAPMEALDLVAQGISRVNSEGGNVTATLKDMGVKGTEETQVMLQLANAGGLLADSLALGNQAWQDNTALLAEAEQRYNTTEAKISVAWNKIKDAAIEAGGVVLPVVANMADAIGGLADWFGDLPGPIQTFLTVLGGVGAAAGLGTAGLLAVSRQVSQLSEAFGSIYGTGGRAQKAISGVGKAIGGITVVGAGLLAGKAAIEGINDAARSGKPDLEAYFNLIATGGDVKSALNFDKGDGITGTVFGDAAEQAKQYYNTVTVEAGKAHRALEALDMMDNLGGLSGWFQKNLSMGDVRAATEEALQLQEAAKGIARAFEMGEGELGSEAFAGLAKQLEFSDEQVAQLINNVPELKSALTQLATDGGIQIDPNDELGLVDVALGRIKGSAPAATEGLNGTDAALAGLGAEAEEVAASLDDILASLFELGRETRTTIEAEDALTNSLSALNTSVGENGKKFEGNSKAAMANREALIGVAADMESLIDAQARGGASAGEIQSTMKSTYDAMMKATGGSEELVRSLLSIPPNVNVKTWMEETAREIADGTAEAIAAIPGYTKVSIAVSEDGTTGQVQSKINEVSGKTEYVFVTDDGTVQNVQAGIASIDGKDVPVYVGDDGTVYSTQGKINGIKGKDVTITANAATSGAESELNHTARPRTSLVTQTVSIKRQITESIKQIDNGPITGRFGGGYTGGLVGRLMNGLAGGGLVPGQIPLNSQGDNILAMVNGKPFGLRSGEMVVNEKATRENYPLLKAINDGLTVNLPGFAGGGLVGTAEKKVKSAQKAYSAIDSKKANKARKQAAKDRLDAAKEELKAAKAQAKLSADAAKDAREKASRLSESRRELRTDLRRGSIVDSFTGGNGLSQVDKLFEASRDTDRSRGARRAAARDAAGLEKALASLTKRSEGLEKALEAAKDKADELRSVRDAVANDLRGEFSLSNFIVGYDHKAGGPTIEGMIGSAKSFANRFGQFAKKLDQLRAKGYSEAVIREVGELGTEQGLIAADALLKGNRSDVRELNKQYRRLDYWSGEAGQSVTESMYKGGLDAADGLVKGLESKNKTVEDAFYKLGKNAEKSFKRSLGIKSPSRVMMAAGVNVGEGAEMGILSKVGDVQSAAEQLMTPPAFTVPPSYEVSRHAAAQSAPVVTNTEEIAAAVASAMSGWQPVVQIDGRKFYGAMQDANRKYNNR